MDLNKDYITYSLQDYLPTPSFLPLRGGYAQGRALRDLDLKTRLFRYRCSPLIYSASFRGFPPELRTLVLARLADILRAEAPPADYAYLPAAERRAIAEILAATLPDLPAERRPK